jgi:hypothetical protein
MHASGLTRSAGGSVPLRSTDGGGNAAFSLPFAFPAGSGNVITATATDAAGNTSEFSQCTVAVGNTAPIATDDQATTVTDGPVTIAPSTNDTDPDVTSPSVLATYRPLPAGSPYLMGPLEVAVVTSTHLGYFGGGNQSVANPGRIGILDTNTNTVTGAITLPVPGAAKLERVNQTTKIVYFRVVASGGNWLEAIDGNSNQAILALNLGFIQSMAIDEAHGRLYVTNTTNASTGNLFQARLTVIDINPVSPTFHQVLQHLPTPGNANVLSVAVNGATNKVYVAVAGNANGVYVINGAAATLTFPASPIAGTANAATLVVDDSNGPSGMVFAAGTFQNGTAIVAIDGATDSIFRSITLPVTATFLSGALDTRLAVHKGTGHVYLRAFEFPRSSRLFIMDGA